MNKKHKELIYKIIFRISILFCIWFIVSYLEVVSNNMEFDNPIIYSDWNFFNLLMGNL